MKQFHQFITASVSSDIVDDESFQYVREEAAEMRIKATAATAAEVARAQDAECSRASERAFFAQRFAERKRELEKLEKRVFPPQRED